MECSCGGQMVEQRVTENKEVVIKFLKCWSAQGGGCGRVYVTWRKEDKGKEVSDEVST